MRLYKDYHLIEDTLYKYRIDESKGLLHSAGSVPAISKELWDKYKGSIKKITFKTNKKRTFKTDKDTFDRNKREINLGYGKQYIIDKELWTIK